MRALAVALLAGLGACVTGSEPVVEPAQEPAREHVAEPPELAAAPEPSVALALESAGAMFPALRYWITVVRWRPGEDLHDRITRYNEFRLVQACDGMRTFPMRWEERERWRREQGR